MNLNSFYVLCLTHSGAINYFFIFILVIHALKSESRKTECLTFNDSCKFSKIKTERDFFSSFC